MAAVAGGGRTLTNAHRRRRAGARSVGDDGVLRRARHRADCRPHVRGRRHVAAAAPSSSSASASGAAIWIAIRQRSAGSFASTASRSPSSASCRRAFRFSSRRSSGRRSRCVARPNSAGSTTCRSSAGCGRASRSTRRGATWRSSRSASPRFAGHEQELDGDGRAAARRDRQRRSPVHFDRPWRRRRVRPADGVRQRRQPAAGARHRPGARNRACASALGASRRQIVRLLLVREPRAGGAWRPGRRRAVVGRAACRAVARSARTCSRKASRCSSMRA